jgi:four helix bundle protein
LAISKNQSPKANHQQMRNFRKWEVYNNAKSCSVLVYQITKDFPEVEKFGLISQLRRASVSVVANIAEGASRSTDKNFKHFLTMSLGSSFEIEAQLDISLELGFITEKDYKETSSRNEVIQKQLNAFISKLKKY